MWETQHIPRPSAPFSTFLTSSALNWNFRRELFIIDGIARTFNLEMTNTKICYKHIDKS